MADTSVFRELGPKTPWETRKRHIYEQFPTASHLDWNVAFEDIELFGRILRDILKLDQSEPGRSGPRPVLDRTLAQQRLRQFMRIDYTELQFREAFQVLAAGRSHRHLANMIGIDRNMVQKLLAGQRGPDIPLMEQVAKAFKKDPSYFLEYRLYYILAALELKMLSSPEIVADLYNKLRPRVGKNGSS